MDTGEKRDTRGCKTDKRMSGTGKADVDRDRGKERLMLQGEREIKRIGREWEEWKNRGYGTKKEVGG